MLLKSFSALLADLPLTPSRNSSCNNSRGECHAAPQVWLTARCCSTSASQNLARAYLLLDTVFVRLSAEGLQCGQMLTLAVPA